VRRNIFLSVLVVISSGLALAKSGCGLDNKILGTLGTILSTVNIIEQHMPAKEPVEINHLTIPLYPLKKPIQ
jgi:hypothetical protein